MGKYWYWLNHDKSWIPHILWYFGSFLGYFGSFFGHFFVLIFLAKNVTLLFLLLFASLVTKVFFRSVCQLISEVFACFFLQKLIDLSGTIPIVSTDKKFSIFAQSHDLWSKRRSTTDWGTIPISLKRLNYFKFARFI